MKNFVEGWQVVMNDELMGIINLSEAEEYLGEITRTRPLAAVPFGNVTV